MCSPYVPSLKPWMRLAVENAWPKLSVIPLYVTGGTCPSTMDDHKKKALRQCHSELRTGIIVSHFLPDLHIHAGGFLTDVESESIAAKKASGNLEQVDELIGVLARKENKDFRYFCVVLEKHGCQAWSNKLKVAAGLGK